MNDFLHGNRAPIKSMNRSLLLNSIRREGQISRTQLTEISGLSVGAVSGIVNELIHNRWVLEMGEGDYTGGRRRTLLQLNPKAGYVVGLKLMEDRVVSAVTNFETTMLDYREHHFTFNDNPDHLSDILATVIEASMTRSGITPDKFFGVGIGLAGVIYPQLGIVHYSPFFGWRDVPLAALVGQRIRRPVYVENDVNTLTLAEQLFGAGRHHNNFVVVTVGRGIGMGMVINGQLYSGGKGGAGELGHIIVQRTDAEDGAGDRAVRSLEDLAADPAISRLMFMGSAGQDPASVNLDEVVAQAQAGDGPAQAALRQSGEWLGIGLANVINILCPELVIISGEGVSAGEYRLAPMLAAMRRYSFNGLLDDVEVIVHPTDDQAWAQGAASLVMSKVFASPSLDVHVVNRISEQDQI